MNNYEIASKLKSTIEHYTMLTVEEHISNKINSKADKEWKKIEDYIRLLIKNGEEK